MSAPVNHQRQRLLFFIAQDLDEDLTTSFKRELHDIAHSRSWVIAQPIFFDEIMNSELGTPVRTVGGVLELYAAYRPHSLPKELDLANLEEVEFLTERLRQYSERKMVAIEFELDGELVGAIEDGKMDRALRDGFIAEWRRYLTGASHGVGPESA